MTTKPKKEASSSVKATSFKKTQNNKSNPKCPTPSRLYVLDTNVLLHDHLSILKFDEHDIYLPLITLEELDDHKQGPSEVARNARAFTRTVNELIQSQPEVQNGFLLPCTKGECCGKLFFQDRDLRSDAIKALPSTKADNKILEVVAALKEIETREVVLVSKDINIRLKAKALGLKAEDYKSDNVVDDDDLLPKGYTILDASFEKKYGRHLNSFVQGSETFYQFKGKDLPQFPVHEFLIYNDDVLRVTFSSETQLVAKLAINYAAGKNSVMGIQAKNEEQNIAMNLLLDEDVDMVCLLGPAGTGKTLLALAAALQQTFVKKLYSEIIVTRATVPVGEEIGFLPGTEEEKMAPWMGAFEDNLEFLSSLSSDKVKKLNPEELKAKLKMKSMSFMRGRTFIKKFLIIDEAQNMTSKQMKTLITRAGEGTKIVCLGNLSQIDTPYLTEASSGLTHVVKTFRVFEHSGHAILKKGERSRLADFASENL